MKKTNNTNSFRIGVAVVAVLLAAFLGTAFAQYPNIRIANVTVTPENQDSIISDYITGTVRYDSASRTLILQNATIYRYDSGDPYDDSNGHTLVVEAHNGQTVNIELIGYNTINGTIPLVLYRGTYNITGTGSLYLNGITEGVKCELGVDTFRIRQGASVVIYDPYTPSIGFRGSPQYQNYGQTVLSIDSGTLIISADYCIQSIVGFQLNGSYIASPGDAYYDPESKTLVTEDGPVHDYLEILPGTVGIVSPQYSANAMKLTVYPNPTDDLLNIELTGAGIANIALYDLQGRAVYSQNSSNSPAATINMHNIPAGVYVLHVTDGDGKEYRQKVVRR